MPACATSSRASGSSPRAAASRSGSRSRATRSRRRSGAPDCEADRLPRRPAPGGRRPRAARRRGRCRRAAGARRSSRSLRGEVAAGAFSPSGKLAYLGLDDPSFSGSSNLGLWVQGRALDAAARRGARPHVLLHRHRRPARLRRASSRCRCYWLDDENVVAPVTDRGSCVPVPLRARRLGRATRRARRCDLHLALGRRRPDRDDRERRRRRVRRLRDRGRRPAAAVAQRRQLVRPVSQGSGAPRRATPRRARDRRVGRSASWAAQQRPRAADPRRPALRPRARAVAGDGRARRRRLHRPLRQPTRLGRLRRGVREGDRGQLGRGGRLRLHAARRLGGAEGTGDRAITSACSGSPTAAT